MLADCVIVAASVSEELRVVTQSGLDSLRAGLIEVGARVTLVETGPVPWAYDGVDEFVQLAGAFGYHRALNCGIACGSAPLVAMLNNDLLYGRGWLDVIADAMRSHDLRSTCPWSHQLPWPPGAGPVLVGCRKGAHVLGHAIVAERSLLDAWGGLPEDVAFRFSDDVYADRLRETGARHGLVRDAVVVHLYETTMRLVRREDPVRARHVCEGQATAYEATKRRADDVGVP